MNRVQVICAGAGLFAAGCLAGTAMADQPHMKSALDLLRSARSELITATPNKGGHRARAIKLVDQAIDETRAGIDFGG
jgi:hypothetical protein